ncbi:hypothetical protein [Peribacillus sp. Hz7]|uniref:hypothetical protein n=1 Tax=Peribacillus sp. Hz7 TaxID=3344873 RepID=UPI0035CBF7F4
MRTFRYFLSASTIIMMMVAGCSSNESEDRTTEHSQEEAVETHKNISTDLNDGIEKVLTALEELQQSTVNKKNIQSSGENLDKYWDVIEKQVEKQYPKDYVDIEKSLYPLLYEAKKEQQDISKIQQLIKETKNKITTFQHKIATS